MAVDSVLVYCGGFARVRKTNCRGWGPQNVEFLIAKLSVSKKSASAQRERIVLLNSAQWHYEQLYDTFKQVRRGSLNSQANRYS